MTFPFSISVDGHPLNVVALDGRPIVTQTVDAAVVAPGERVDFWIEASDSEGLGNYWIRAETLERVDFADHTFYVSILAIHKSNLPHHGNEYNGTLNTTL